MVLQLDEGTPEEPSTLAKEILGYFLRNPQAVDNLEGIARWRLQEERIRQQIRDASVALDWLVKRRYLEKLSSPMAEPVYRLNEANRSAVERFFARGAGGKRKGDI